MCDKVRHFYHLELNNKIYFQIKTEPKARARVSRTITPKVDDKIVAGPWRFLKIDTFNAKTYAQRSKSASSKRIFNNFSISQN